MEQPMIIERAPAEIDYKLLARYLLDEAIAFYQDPENERKFQEWMKERKGA